ncbi:MAG: 16S rRNA (guanine(527)-N(7))-methyltransferase RsmG [Bacteroidales bacterium]|nr:16S rRNA (guanine(527)-N(7))-methyltransferase RsmG [Bacteroidales bacterium]
MITVADKYFPSLTEEQRRQLSLLPSLYKEWNSRINIISRKDIENFEINHLLHSLAIARFVTFMPGTAVIDVGTGGGLPGIPLAILFPQAEFTLIDSIAKKIRVVNEIIAATGIRNVLARAARSEEITGQYDFIIGRAVTNTKQFVSLTRHLASPRSFNEVRNGWILLKGGDLEREVTPFRASAEVIPVSRWFDEPYFETKKIVYLPR